MSDPIKHECGIAMIRLRKPLGFYYEKYNPTYALNKMYLLMEKQKNRGQDGAGIANIKIDINPGHRYISRLRSIDKDPIDIIFKKALKKINKAKATGDHFFDPNWMKEHIAFTGELWMGHLRYGTYGDYSLENCHPFLRQNNWRSRNLVVAGNFNMTNVDELFEKLVDLGQHPKERVDTVTVMEKIGHFLDQENQKIFDKHKNELSNQEITSKIDDELDLQKVLSNSFKDFDGGYTIGGLIGNGHSFVVRDPAGIRPAYYYVDEEVVVVASEKPAIKTAFNVRYDEIREVQPGHALIVSKSGQVSEELIVPPLPKKACSFERIYFSRGSDPDIYNERKALGRLLVPQILDTIRFDLKNTVFSYIPNTAETAFLGMMNGIENYLIGKRKDIILDNKPFIDSIDQLLSFRPRVEKLVIKDVKLRTFITDDEHRDEMVAHVYDTTYEVIKKNQDTIVVIDDSIVRGTTLEKSIIRMLDLLEPKHIVIVSSAPQIRFPDCYGIDMSRMKEFVAFRAALELLKDRGLDSLLDRVYEQCVAAVNEKNPPNFVKQIYEPFSYEEISDKIGEIVKPNGLRAKLSIVYQTVDSLHKAMPNYKGDWYFTGNYPTPGGNKTVNNSFRNFMEGKLIRAYS